MFMRSPAYASIDGVKNKQINHTGSLTIRERIVETGQWTIAIPAIATVSLSKSSRPVFRTLALFAAFLSASAGLTNYALQLMLPPVPWLLASAALSVIFVLLALRDKDRYVLAMTANDGSRCAVTSNDKRELENIRAFLAEKINSQDCKTARTFELQSASRKQDHQAPRQLLAAPAQPPAAQKSKLNEVVPQHAEALLMPANDIDGARTDESVDYASVVGQVTDLHRFYERHPQAAHIRERLSEMELLMRSGTPSETQRARMRELALDLSNIMAAYPHMTQLFAQVTRLAGGTAKIQEAASG